MNACMQDYAKKHRKHGEVKYGVEGNNTIW